MEQSINKQNSEAKQTVTDTQLVVKFTKSVPEWAKHFFTLTEEEKVAAGICSSCKNNHT